jgi:hypothetical protein
MKILIFFAAYKRLEVLKVCLEGIERLKKKEGFEIRSLAVCTGKDESELCKLYGCKTIRVPNNPLGRKKNRGIKEALKYDFDYLLEAGSDDLIHESLLDDYLPEMIAGTNFFGVNKCTFFETATGRIAEWENDFVIGAGRMFSRKLLEHCGDIWSDDRMRSLDRNSMMRLVENGVHCKIIPVPAWKVLDIKTTDNLNGFEWFENLLVTTPTLDYYPHEKEMILKLS